MKLLLHPLPVRLFHWTMVICVVTLVFTGLYLSSPWDTVRLPLSLVRKVHMSFGIVLLINFLGQVYYYLYTGKYTEMVLQRRDLPNVRSFVRYVLFITAHHPNYGRYNPGQKLLFMGWGLAVLISAVSSIALVFPDNTVPLQRLLGGLYMVRVIHYFLAVFFGITIVLHLYLVFTEDPANLQAMFTGYVKKEPRFLLKSPSGE